MTRFKNKYENGPEGIEIYGTVYEVDDCWMKGVIKFLKDLNDPEGYGFSVTSEVRAVAKRLLNDAT